MKIYVFGNECVAEDKRAIEVARELDGAIEGISFVFVGPNKDVPFLDERSVVILDTVQGLQDVALIEEDEIDRLDIICSLKKVRNTDHCRYLAGPWLSSLPPHQRARTPSRP